MTNKRDSETEEVKQDKNKPEVERKSRRPELIRAVTGMYEILPEEAPWWDKLRKATWEAARFYDFQYIDTGIIEQAELFTRTVGEETDIVSKEMFYIKSRTHNWVLRPEATASVVRAYLEYGMARQPQPVKMFYFGPMFRHERPQAGRYRQLRQTGFEIIGGENDPVFDAQLMLVALRILRDLGLKEALFEINSIGCRVCQPNIKKKIINYYKNRKGNICSDCENRLNRNPLLVLDCKEATCRELAEGAPVLLDNVCSNCRTHFRNLLEYLDELEVPYELNNSLVRGLDYYSRTVFELFMPGSEQERLAIGGGGRYDYLVEILGGRPTPGLGFAFGLERLVKVMKEKKGEIAARNRKNTVFFIHVGEVAKKKSLGVIEKLRESGIAVIESLSKDSLSKQLALADKYGVELVLLFGQKEVYEESVIIKNLKTGIQETILIKNMVEEVKKRLK